MIENIFFYFKSVEMFKEIIYYTYKYFKKKN